MQYSADWLTVAEARRGIIMNLLNGKVDAETNQILPFLISLNAFGFLTHESQPSYLLRDRTFQLHHSAWVSGFYPTIKAKVVLNAIVAANPEIMASEVDGHNEMFLYNYDSERDDPHLIGNHYPDLLFQTHADNILTYDTTSYTGYIKYKPHRDEFWDDANPALIQELDSYSLIHIWARTFDEPLFPTLVSTVCQYNDYD